MEFSEIARKTNHSIEAIANYVEKFTCAAQSASKRVVCLAKDNHEIPTIAFLVKISPTLAQQYYDLYLYFACTLLQHKCTKYEVSNFGNSPVS